MNYMSSCYPDSKCLQWNYIYFLLIRTESRSCFGQILQVLNLKKKSGIAAYERWSHLLIKLHKQIWLYLLLSILVLWVSPFFMPSSNWPVKKLADSGSGFSLWEKNHQWKCRCQYSQIRQIFLGPCDFIDSPGLLQTCSFCCQEQHCCVGRSFGECQKQLPTQTVLVSNY